jgi:hypothetical protein
MDNSNNIVVSTFVMATTYSLYALNRNYQHNKYITKLEDKFSFTLNQYKAAQALLTEFTIDLGPIVQIGEYMKVNGYNLAQILPKMPYLDDESRESITTYLNERTAFGHNFAIETYEAHITYRDEMNYWSLMGDKIQEEYSKLGKPIELFSYDVIIPSLIAASSLVCGAATYFMGDTENYIENQEL